MDLFKEYLLQNWALILILMAFVIMLVITVFLDRKTVRRMFILIVAVLLLSVSVFFEFHLSDVKQLPNVRIVLTAIRYSATPIILALIVFTLVKRARWYVLIPAFAVMAINIISIFTGIVFSIDDSGELKRGILGYLPYAGVAVYGIFLTYILIKQSNKQASEIIPIVFLVFCFGTGLILPLAIGKDYSKIFCTTIAIGLFVYYVFLILQLTKKDALTGVLNRQAYYAVVRGKGKDITAFVSIDMNGLKIINDTGGHIAGDEALITIAHCISKATKVNQSIYRIGGDEFVIICRKTSQDELELLVNKIKENVAETNYSCSIGYSYSSNGEKELDDMIKESDEMMYSDKARYYSASGRNRRAH